MDMCKKLLQFSTIIALLYLLPLHMCIGIVNYMKRQVGPSSTLLKSAEDVKKFIKSPNEPRVVAYFSESTNSKLVDAFVESGNLLRMDMKLAHCTNADVATEMGQKVETVVVYHGT